MHRTTGWRPYRRGVWGEPLSADGEWVAPKVMQTATRHSSSASTREGTRTGFRAVAGIDRGARDPDLADRIARAKQGDMSAIRWLYVRYKDNIYGYVLSIVRDPYEAEDVTQQVFLKLMSVMERYEPRSVPFTSWLLRVARNVAVDHLRARRSLPCAEVHGVSDEVDEAGRERRWGLEQALEALPAEQRNVVVLRHLVGLTPGEIAIRMGRSEAAVHGLHHRGRKAICRELSDIACAPTTVSTGLRATA